MPTLDLAILVAYVLATVAFGSWIGRGQRSGTDYMAGGRNLPWWALLFSIVATETSTVTFLSVPGDAYFDDLTFLQLPIGYLVGRTLVTVVLIPLYFEGRFLTAYEVLQKRFGTAVRRTASALFIVTRTLADGLRLYLTAMVLEKLTALSMTQSVLAMGGATLVYTVLGGMKAVVWTDFVQFLVYMAGAAVAFGLVLGGLPGGWSEVVAAAGPDDKLRVFDFTFALDDPKVFWAGLIGGAVLTFGTHGVDQLVVQRYLCARSRADAGKALMGSAVVVLLQFAFFLLLGVALFAFYRQHPPGTAFTQGDDVFADFVVNHLPAGVLGIVLGAVFSAAMSTLSSSINSSATALVNDFWLPLTDHDGDSAQALVAARLATVLFAAAQVGVGVSGLGGGSIVHDVLAIASVTTGLLLGVFLLGIRRPPPSVDAIAGMAGGLTVASFFAILLPLGHRLLITDPVLAGAGGAPLAWPWWSLVGMTTTYLVARGLERLTGPAIPP